MCTVTIIPIGKSDFVLTSNRDEAPDRISLKPEEYTINDSRMLFPKDKTAGGSWIGVSDKNRVLCVLNGGFVHHERLSEYRLSRGVVMRDLLACEQIDKAIDAYSLEDVEPFTLVIADWNNGLQFFELIWDGKQKHFNKLPLKAKMWSSSTLYSEDMKQERQQWFSNFRTTNDLNADSLLDFHLHTETKNTDYGVIMDRGFVKTTSVTQVSKVNSHVEMKFFNLQENYEYNAQFIKMGNE